MATCDYCGQTYRGWAIKDGQYRFCNTQCRKQGQVLKLLDNVALKDLDDYIARAHAGPCPTCYRPNPVDAHPSYWVYSLIVYTRWSKSFEIQCHACARKRQLKDPVFCLACGWWGIPFGFIITPVQLIANLLAMLPKNVPSERFRQMSKLHLALQLAQRVNR
jgi:hypothetical protein